LSTSKTIRERINRAFSLIICGNNVPGHEPGAGCVRASFPSHSFIFIDANIFIYGLSGQSAQSAQFPERCLQEDVTGITLFKTVNEATHRFMVTEALVKGLIMRGTANRLREQFRLIPTLSDYWVKIERPLALNLTLCSGERGNPSGCAVRAPGFRASDE
jgi:hypothetical protein